LSATPPPSAPRPKWFAHLREIIAFWNRIKSKGLHMKLEVIKISTLKLDPHNARTHDQANLDAIAGSLIQFGQRKPIVISQDNTVVAGNGTVTSATALGWETIEAVRVPADWDADRIKAFALADNRTAELADWNQHVMANQLIELQEVGFDIEEFGFSNQVVPSFEPIEANERLDVKEPKFCPGCGHDITNY